jgi:hypothetical protein
MRPLWEDREPKIIEWLIGQNFIGPTWVIDQVFRFAMSGVLSSNVRVALVEGERGAVRVW